MTVRDFLDASYALFVEEQGRINPLSALLDISDAVKTTPSVQTIPSPVRKQQEAADNQANLNILTAAMSGVKRGGPSMGKAKKPRV